MIEIKIGNTKFFMKEFTKQEVLELAKISIEYAENSSKNIPTDIIEKILSQMVGWENFKFSDGTNCPFNKKNIKTLLTLNGIAEICEQYMKIIIKNNDF